ncbi:MAG: putative ABC transporter permease [Clostridium sp.]|nr:MAG: putative ABC transporter permease [Clostridium sp.]
MREFKIYFLLFMTYSFIGWIIEIIDRFKSKQKKIVNRGFLIGPYIPIYGCCSIVMILLLHSVKNPITLFTSSILIASIGEYLTSYIMEKKHFMPDGGIIVTINII